jgi:DNA-binding HxlR family transcriptional regulator
VHLYLGELIAKRLIAQDVSSPDGIMYRTTERGREFLQYYTRLTEFLEEQVKEEEEEQQQPKVESSATAAPYVSRSWIR